MAGNPDLLLGTNFGVKGSAFAKFSKGAAIMPEYAAHGQLSGRFSQTLPV